ncbi:MAG TPA: response regulator transcription factor [Oligoflexia bacterium]|nr:response regulator transcription factor [Oligoflexia bacterium]HMP27899.1 response regulator transcription factor [Oligoflexia bacterium]
MFNPSNFTVAVIDDDEAVRSSLLMNLEYLGYKTSAAADGDEGFDLVREKQPDIIVLDVMMPKKDGLQLCKQLRAEGVSTPIILLTARSAEIDRVLGLELGADDYLPKPFGMPELLARIKAILRRMNNGFAIEKVQFDNVVIDFKAYRAQKGGEPLDLSAREYRLLRHLVSRKGTVVTRDELLNEVWGYNAYPTTRTVDNHIAKLRSKIERNLEAPEHIITVHGVGYKFVA